MAAQIITVTEAYRSARYDGTNGADIVAAVPDAVLDSDDGTTLEFDIAWSMGTNHYIATSGQWVVWRVLWGSTEIFGVLDDAVYTQRLAPLPS